MASRLRRILSLGSETKNKDIVQSNEIRAPAPEDFNNWTIPRQNLETIYKIGFIDLKTALSVKTHEETINIRNKREVIPLLRKEAIQKHIIS